MTARVNGNAWARRASIGVISMDCLTVTVAQAAELLGLSEKTIRQMETVRD